MTALEVNCPHQFPDYRNCGAGVDEPCRLPDGSPAPDCHDERKELATSATPHPPNLEVTAGAFDRAVERYLDSR